MRILLIRDVYKLGKAGEVKQVADGYGRNYLIPQGLAVKATPGALKQVDRIRQNAQQERSRLNLELGDLAETLAGLKLTFPVKASETGKLYGSITAAMLSEAIKEHTGVEVDRRQIESEPIKTLGVHGAKVRLTIDLIPELTLLVHREGEPPESAYAIEGEAQPAFEERFAELQAELEAEADAERAQGIEEASTQELEAESGTEQPTLTGTEAEGPGDSIGEA